MCGPFDDAARKNCPPESGGQRDREADPARGGSKDVHLQDGSVWNHPGAARHPS